jgi:hypothetical protein
MNAKAKSHDEITSIADWERRYLPNGDVLDLMDFGSEPLDENTIDIIAKELTRPVQNLHDRLDRKRKSNK